MKKVKIVWLILIFSIIIVVSISTFLIVNSKNGEKEKSVIVKEEIAKVEDTFKQKEAPKEQILKEKKLTNEEAEEKTKEIIEKLFR